MEAVQGVRESRAQTCLRRRRGVKHGWYIISGNRYPRMLLSQKALSKAMQKSGMTCSSNILA